MTTSIQLSAKTSAISTRPEVKLLLCCTRTYINRETAKQITVLLQGDINWEYLIQIATQHGVMPLLYRSLNTTCSTEVVPKAILNQLQDYVNSNGQSNLFHTAKLLKLLKVFQAHKIPVIPFKGPVLAASAYGDLALRCFGDLDLLIHKQDFPIAKDLLISQGYQLQNQYRWESNFVNKESRVCVDLHQGLAPIFLPFPLDFDNSWKRCEPISLADMTLSSFCAEDLLLILCLNIVRDYLDSRQQLSQICDIAELIRTHQKMNWNYVMEQASRLGSQRIVFLGLRLASELLQTKFPEEVHGKIQADSVAKLLAAMVSQSLFCARSRPNIFEGSFFYLMVREHLRNRAQPYPSATIPNKKNSILLPLHRFLFFPYYFLLYLARKVKIGLDNQVWQKLQRL